MGAARDAAKAKRLSDDYIKAAPSDVDGYYTLGLYNYYVALAPSFVKVLSVLLFLPSGDRVKGLEQIEKAQAGEFWAQEAQFNLVDIYSDLEGRPDDALRLASQLKRAYPDNPKAQMTYADTLMHPTVEDYAGAAAEYADVAKRAKAREPNYRDIHFYRATGGLAGAYQQQWRIEDAIATLTPAIDSNVAKPRWVMPNFLLRRGAYRSQLGDRQATEDIQRILGDRHLEPWHKGAQRQLKSIQDRLSSSAGTVYTALIPGNRLVAERRWSEAEAFYAKAERDHNGHVQVKYRQALLEFERNRLDKSAELFQHMISTATKATPSWIRGAAMLYRARIHDLWGQRELAMNLYKRILDEFDEADFAAQAAKVGTITPYRRAARSTT